MKHDYAENNVPTTKPDNRGRFLYAICAGATAIIIILEVGAEFALWG